MFEKNKEKMKEKMEPDKVLRFAIVAVILLFLIGALIIGTRMMNPRASYPAMLLSPAQQSFCNSLQMHPLSLH